MKKLWQFSGLVAFWLSWPALFFYLYFSKRTRILVVCGDEVLVVRGWLSSGGWWGLPGGGLHPGEDLAAGAVRELNEETGIEVNATELQFLLSGRAPKEFGLTYNAYVYVLNLKSKPKLSKQKLEITHLEWLNWKALYEDPKTGISIKEIIDAWQNSL